MDKGYKVKTKIVCTLGPASSDESSLRKMTRAGMDIGRINFSHGTLDVHAERIATVRATNRKYRRAVKILGDLEGPRIRMGSFPRGNSIQLQKGTVVFLAKNDTRDTGALPIDYEGDINDFQGASHLYLDDGSIVLKLVKIESKRIRARVVVGGLLKERKALNVPGADLKFPALSDKDKEDIDFAVSQRVAYLAQSFVRSADDITAVREYLGKRLPSCKIIAKIENQDGVDNLEDIIKVADGVMVARGDLGVCVPIYEMPLIQKRIIRACNRKKKMVITATQMLESMVESITPTRAEVTDVANAVIDGTDAVMLSAETAIGDYPVECVEMMNKIVKYTELYAEKG